MGRSGGLQETEESPCRCRSVVFQQRILQGLHPLCPLFGGQVQGPLQGARQRGFVQRVDVFNRVGFVVSSWREWSGPRAS